MSSIQANTALPPSIPASNSASASPSSQPQSDRDAGVAPSSVARPPSGSSMDAPVDQLLYAESDARQIVRLLQCQICSRVLQEPVTLPCGQTLCKACLPATHTRTNISWPATSNRLKGLACPFADCAKEHAAGDCSVDVALNKAIVGITSLIELNRDVTGLTNTSTRISVQDRWAIAGMPSLVAKSSEPLVLKGGRIVATYTAAKAGQLEYDAEVTYESQGIPEDQAEQVDIALFSHLKETARGEMDCQVCYALYLDPFTTACGHTFCRACVKRILDHSNLCPICRRELSIQAHINTPSSPSNLRLKNIITGFWADLVALRTQAYKLESQANPQGFDVPLFICTLSLPHMPTFLHIFESRYRLMIRRAMENDQTFGMVPYRRAGPGEPQFREYGTLLRIRDIQYLADGRSLLETVGVSRFRVTRHGMMDGYTVGNIEKIDDISVSEEEAVEAAETMRLHGVQNFVQPEMDSEGTESPNSVPLTRQLPMPISLDDLDIMSTQELLQYATDFVQRMHARSVSWLVPRIMSVYGEAPSDPAMFPWWFASILPVREDEKYRLLSMRSVRKRMKICCQWVIEWEASRWSIPSSVLS